MGGRNEAYKQAMDWLNSMKHSDNAFEAINAGNATALIFDQQRRLKRMQMLLGQAKSERDNYRKILAGLYKASEDEKNAGIDQIPKEYYCEGCAEFVRPDFVWEEGEGKRYLFSVCPNCGKDLEFRCMEKVTRRSDDDQ